MVNEVMTTIVYMTAFSTAYIVNKKIELGYVSRHTSVTPEQLVDIGHRITEFRRERGLTNILAARMLEKTEKDYRSRQEETPLSKRLREHWDQLFISPGAFIARELTTFPTFRS